MGLGGRGGRVSGGMYLPATPRGGSVVGPVGWGRGGGDVLNYHTPRCALTCYIPRRLTVVGRGVGVLG